MKRACLSNSHRHPLLTVTFPRNKSNNWSEVNFPQPSANVGWHIAGNRGGVNFTIAMTT